MSEELIEQLRTPTYTVEDISTMSEAADLIEHQAARIAELEARASIELTQSQNHDHVRKLARLHPIASEETADLARPLPDKPW